MHRQRDLLHDSLESLSHLIIRIVGHIRIGSCEEIIHAIAEIQQREAHLLRGAAFTIMEEGETSADEHREANVLCTRLLFRARRRG